MPEAGYLPIPAKLARAGVKDMVRISDARMSGTAFGTVVLHVSPESAIGGPLGLVRYGRPDQAQREGAAPRRAGPRAGAGAPAVRAVSPPRRPRADTPGSTRSRVLGAELGCDFDFLRQKPVTSG